MNIYISTCDSYDRILKPFSYLFNKFWDSSLNVTILGYRKPPFELPENFKFVSLGKEQISVNHWSTDLHNFFSSIEDEHFIYAVEDLFICDYVDVEAIEKLIENLDEKTGRIALVNVFEKHCNWNVTNDYGRFKVGTATNSSHKFSTIWSLFNRQWFLKYVLPKTQEEMDRGEGNPWYTEVNGDNMSTNDGWNVKGPIGVSPIKFTSAVRKGWTPESNKPFDFLMSNEGRSLDESVIQDMIDKKLISESRGII